MTDWRALSAQLLRLNDHPDTDHAQWSAAIERVRDAFDAETQGDGLTDEQLLHLAADALGFIQKNPPWDFDPTPMDADQVLTIARAVIAADRARCGRPALMPINLSQNAQ